MKKNFLISVSVFLGGVSLGVGQTIPRNVTFRDFFIGTTFTRPIFFAEMPGRDSVFVIGEQNGNVQLMQRVGGTWTKSLFVSVTVTGGTTGGDEQGLLGFAFHPNYTSNHKYYLFYVRNLNGLADYVVERVADATLLQDGGTPSRTVLRITDPASNHNGGYISFGRDGFLYIGTGDGGGADGQYGTTQNRTALLAKMLRIDVDGVDAFPTDSARNYAIPATNPFVGNNAYTPEVWAMGLRNPYRWTFHPANNGEIWVGDVGQNTIEEVDRVTIGSNMGWNIWEGNQCFPNGTTGCSLTGFTGAVFAYPRSYGYSVTGGVFFSGDPTSSYHNVYIFGDYGSGRIFAMRASNGTMTDTAQIGNVPNVSSFANDSRGRVFAMGLNQGVIRILESPDMRPNPTAIRKFHGQKPISKMELNEVKYDLKTVNGRKVKPGKKTGLIIATDRKGKTPAQLVPAIW